MNDVFFLRGEDGELGREVAFKSAASTLGMPALAETFTHFHRDFHAVKVTVKLRGSIEPLPCEPQTFTPARQGASKMAILPRIFLISSLPSKTTFHSGPPAHN